MSEFIKMVWMMQGGGFQEAFKRPADGTQDTLLKQLAASPWTIADGDLYRVKGPVGGIPGVFKLFHDAMKSGVLQGDPELAESAADAFLSFLEAMRVQEVCRFCKGQTGGEECARQVSECIAAMIHGPDASGRYQLLFAKALRLEMINLPLLFALVPGLNITIPDRE